MKNYFFSLISLLTIYNIAKSEKTNYDYLLEWAQNNSIYSFTPFLTEDAHSLILRQSLFYIAGKILQYKERQGLAAKWSSKAVMTK